MHCGQDMREEIALRMFPVLLRKTSHRTSTGATDTVWQQPRQPSNDWRVCTHDLGISQVFAVNDLCPHTRHTLLSKERRCSAHLCMKTHCRPYAPGGALCRAMGSRVFIDQNVAGSGSVEGFLKAGTISGNSDGEHRDALL